MIARPLRAYPELAAWLGEGFCFAVRVGAYDVYARRPADGSPCAASGFPRPHSAVDMFGRPLRVPLPPTVDAAITHTIDEDESRYYEPRWFDGDPAPPQVDAARATARGFDFDPWGLLAP